MKTLNEQTVQELNRKADELIALYPGDMGKWLENIGVEPSEMFGETSPKATLVLLANKYFNEAQLSYVEFLEHPLADPKAKALVQSMLEIGFMFGYLYNSHRDT